MPTAPRTRAALGALLVGAVALAGCAASDPLADGSGAVDADPIVVGSQDYYSNEIIAEIYAQSLEAAGFAVERDLRIGQREVTVPELESGAIDLFPEYSGPLLQVWDPDAAATTSEDVYDALVAAAPDGVRVLAQSPATDQDAYVVSRAFAEEHGFDSLADLSDVEVPLTLGGSSEGAERPNGPRGLAAAYGLDVTLTPIEDGGGPLTVEALRSGEVQLAILYTASPAIASPDLVVLDDPAGLLLASHVVPVASATLPEEAVAIVDRISAAMSAEDLLALDVRSVETQAPAATIAAEWLEAERLLP